MADKLKWGILSTGSIAKAFARDLPQSDTGKLVAVGSRTKPAADEFGKEFGLDTSRCYGSYDALLADDDVQVVYIATPHPMHAQWAIRTAEAGKHVLVEKPAGLNQYEAMAMIEAAHENGVFFMEAFMYRCHPQTAKLIALLRERVVGDVGLISATFSFNAGFNPDGRLLNQALGGGGILDVGCYCASMSRLVAGAAAGLDAAAEPLDVRGHARIGPVSRVDEYAVATAAFPGGIVAQLATGVMLNQENALRIYGTEGSIVVPEPWVPSRNGGSTRIVVNRQGEQPREIVVESPKPIYALEADAVAQSIERGDAAFPAMSCADTMGNMRMLDLWRLSIGLVYDAELPENNAAPLHGRPIEVRSGSRMKYTIVPGIAGPVSRLVLGVDNQTCMPHAAVMFDAFFEHGGNCFDTAWVYGGGACERLLGQWIASRGVREDVIVLCKGAHTPWCTPDYIPVHLNESLERLKTDYVDLYMMHRDNLGVGVDEFIDVLNELQSAGKIRAFGASNWTLERFQAANDCARRRGLNGFSALSNNFSLARMLEPCWTGCVSCSGPQWHKWLIETQTPVFAWSSQAQGFFAGRARHNDHSDTGFVTSWYSDANFERLKRAQELAGKVGVPVVNIALAYVLCQPFPTFPLIGPRTLAELRACLPALDIELNTKQLAWLDLADL